MSNDSRECLKRAEYCSHLALSEKDPKMRQFLLNLAASWTQVAQQRLGMSLSLLK